MQNLKDLQKEWRRLGIDGNKDDAKDVTRVIHGKGDKIIKLLFMYFISSAFLTIYLSVCMQVIGQDHLSQILTSCACTLRVNS